ncbi:MAG: PDZ domain-containing protein [Candidatus Aminicenantes bacterium]|nr:MAG: PDZ domain-containing protein [Candidatus Aminicenantes bacterium]
MTIKKITAISIFLLTFSILCGQEEEDKILLLKIGDKKLKDKTINVSAGKIYSARAGSHISFQKMIKEMKESEFIYVGETHNSLPMHDIQSKIIQALYEQDRNLSIGLEMFPVSFQEALNKWSMAILSQDEFIRESRWYVNWNFNFGFYEKIFKLAKNNKIPLYALNAPRAIIRKIRMKGWGKLSEDEKKAVPKPDVSHEEHRILIRTIFESMELPHQMKGGDLDMVFEGLYRAQSAWDEVMAFNALQSREREGRKMVVLVGSGHLLYNLGINRRAYEKNRLPFKTVICVVIPEGKKSIKVARSLADYVWSINEEKMPIFPSIGLRFKKFDRLDNLVIESKPIDGISKNANFEKGDVVLSVDGKSFSDINELRIYLAEFNWDDEVKFCLLRNAQQLEVLLKFQPPEKKGQGS